MGEILTLPVAAISISGGTQSRVALNQETVEEYADVIRFAGELPPVVVFNDGASDGLWLADGFHRFHAHRAAGAIEITCDVRVGTQREAILFSVGANASHGLRRTNEDKRRAVCTLLNDSEWSAWSDREIASQCGVSHSFVAAVRSPAIAVKQQENRQVSAAKTVKVESDSTLVAEKTPILVESDSALAGIDAPAPTAAASFDELEDLRDRYDDLAESFKATQAENEMMARVFDADDRLKAALAEVARHKAIAENAERTLFAKNGEFVERANSVKYWQNRAEKAEKKLKALEVQS